MAPKDPCVYCQETTGVRNASKGSVGALQCGVCKNWAHYECTKLSEDAIKSFAMLIDLGVADKPYRCNAYKGALRWFRDSYNALKAAVFALQTNLQETEYRVQVLEDRNVTSTVIMDIAEPTVIDLQQNVSTNTEVFEREQRASNVIIFEG